MCFNSCIYFKSFYEYNIDYPPRHSFTSPLPPAPPCSKSALWEEGSQAKTCDQCSTNYNTRCCVCSDALPFARNLGMACKYCANRSGCVKCGSTYANTPAFVCDTCLSRFRGQCVRTTQYN